jgi:AraC-like DNA-binding protein
MENFMSHNFNIEKIIIACYVSSHTAKPSHRNRPSHGITFHTGGSKSTYFHDFGTLNFGKNDILYMPKGSNYDTKVITHGDCYAINFELSEDFSCKPFVFHTKNSNVILDYFKKATAVWNERELGAEMKCKAELYNVIYSLQQEFREAYFPHSKINQISKAVELIHKNYTNENLSIAKLSAMCNITPEYFRKIFKQHYGLSPIAYINNLKISRAKELLLSGANSVTEAALKSGYTDISHFSREFKKATGFSPKDFKGF